MTIEYDQHGAERSPEIRVIMEGVEVCLERKNTRIRIFNPPTYNSVDYIEAPGEVLSFTVDEDTMEALVRADYPMILMNILDDPTHKVWFENLVAGNFASNELHVEDIR